MDIIDRRTRARDFDLYNIPSLDTFGIGDYGQEARLAQIKNEAAESVSDQLKQALYEDTVKAQPLEKGWFESIVSNSVETVENMPGVGSLVKGITSLTDPWRLANVLGHQVNLDKKYFELSNTEGKWLPELLEAEKYLNYKQELLDLNKDILINENVWSDEQLASAYTRQKQITTELYSLEPVIKNLARTNPYLLDIFYETKPGELFKDKLNFGSIKDLLKYYTYDYVNADYSADINPGNNFKHMLASDGVESPLFGRIGQLSPAQIDFMWNSRNINDANSIATLNKQLADAISIASVRKGEQEEDILSKINTIKKGNLLFDPTRIDPEFKAKFENNQVDFSEPMSWYYALPHLGSSYSEFGAMIGQMGASAMLNYAAKGALAASTGGTLPLLYALTEAGVNLSIASYMRDSETSSEAFSAYQERVLNTANEFNIPLPRIVEQTKNSLSKLGYDTDNMSDYELFLASVAQQLKTNDPKYNEILQNSKAGLEVLKQTNAALSIPDYVESTLFSYGGLWLSKAYGLKKALAGKPMLSAEMQQSIANKSLAEAGNGIIDKTISRVADKVVKNPINKVVAKDAISTVAKIGKAAGLSYFTERTEEGVQNIVSTRYKQGKYDNNENYSLLNGAANMLNLGVEANLAYYGLHPDNTLNTDKDLHNEMAIGGFTGLFMTGAYGAKDTYEGVKQTITDTKLRGVVADHYGDAETDNKVELFIKAAQLSKDGNFGRIRLSLESLKEYKPEGVTNDMIDEDIKLANRVSQLVASKQINKLASELNIDNSSSEYAKIINNAINLQNRLSDQTKASTNSTKLLGELLDKIKSDDALKEHLLLWYELYKSAKLSKDKDASILTFEQYSDSVLEKMLSVVDNNVVEQLDTELTSRKLDLTLLKKDLGFDVNIDGISGISKYVKRLLKLRRQTLKDITGKIKKQGFEGLDEDIIKQINDEIAVALPFMDELKSALTSKYINDGALDDLTQHLRAYVVGQYDGDTKVYRPTWDNLTEEQRKVVLTNAALEDEENNRTPRTEKDVILQYDSGINRQWEVESELADTRESSKRRALSVILKDLLRRTEKEKQAKKEKLEELGTSAEEPVVTSQEEELANTEILPTTPLELEDQSVLQLPNVDSVVFEDEETKETKTPPKDEMKEEGSEVERLLDKLEEEDRAPLELDLAVVDEEDIPEYSDQNTDNTEQKKFEEQVENVVSLDDTTDLTEIELKENSVEITNIGDEESANAVDEIITQEELDSAEETKEENETSLTETVKKEVPKTDVPTDTPTVIPGKQDLEKVDTPTFEQGLANEIYVDPTTDLLMWDPTGAQDPSNSITVGDELLDLLQTFDDTFAQDPSIGPATYSNDLADMDAKNPIVTKSKQKKAYISNTFFYLPTTDEVMPITVAGKTVKFITKDGKEAERRPGRELAENLATPGWLSTIDDAYYIVTSSTHDMTGISAVKNLAVHLIIEKDGKVYNTSLRAISDQLRDDLLKLGMNVEDVDAQINNLLALRQKIINAYAPNYFSNKTLPVTASKHVKPTNLRISNGTLNNQIDENGLPVYRRLNEVVDFKMPTESKLLSDDITSGEIELGYGTGPFGIDPFTVVKLDLSDLTSSLGRGYAGKIYYVPKVENTPSQTTTLPIMLAEELHRIPGVENVEDLQVSKNVDGTVNRDKDGKPIPMSTAELIYELLVNGIFHSEVDDFLLNILGNNGPKTVVLGLTDKEKHNFNFLVRKQLHVYTNNKDERYLISGGLKDYSRPQLGYTTRFTNLEKITDAQKRRIVFEISLNIHWNTDKNTLMLSIPNKVADLLLSLIKKEPLLAPTADTLIKFANDAITFSLRELGYDIINGKPKKVSEPINMAAWFINHKKLKTDLGDHAFYAPFVYADDISIKEAEKPVVESPRESVTSSGKVIAKQDPVKATPNKNKGNNKSPVIAEPATLENLDKYGLQIPKDLVLLDGFTWGIITDRKGNKKVTLAPKNKVLGVFSTVRGSKIIDIPNAKEWLISKLGLDPSNIIVTNAVMRTISDDKIYGVMRVVADSINELFTPQILLSTQSGEGVEYHEAFHYVSLLLLNENRRNQIYQEYVDTHSGTSEMSKLQVEEALAEEFRHYMLDSNTNNIGKKIIKFFNDIKEYIKSIFGKTNISRLLFNAIKKGEFADIKVDEAVKLEFHDKYNEGIFYYIPGLTKEQIQNMPNIMDSNTFYLVAEALTSTALSMYNIRTVEDVKNLNIDKMFETILDHLDAGWIDDDNFNLVLDVVDNEDIFRQSILDKLNQLGIREVDKLLNLEDERLDVENGDNPDNSWDKNQGEVTKKDNISFRAKLFFYSIPKYEYTFVRNEETGVVEKQLQPVIDDIFGLPVTESFDQVWNKIMENLWDIDNYNDIVNECARLSDTDPFFHSLHNILTSETKPIDENTKTQLEVTIKSAKVQMNTINVKSDTPNITYDMSDEQRSDETAAAIKRSLWEVLDSDNLRKIRRLPSKWSKAFFSSDNVIVDEDGNRSINPKSVLYLKHRRQEIDKISKQIHKGKKNLGNAELLLQQMQDNFLQICNAIQIPFDSLSLDYLLDQIKDTRLTDNPKLNKFLAFWESKYQLVDQVGDKEATTYQSFNKGILGDIMLLGVSQGSTIKKRSGQGSARTLDRIFNYSSPTALINRMAVAYGKVHPSPLEFSVVGADGSLVYPISENNYMTDQLRNINKKANGKVEQILSTPYSKRSLIANAKNAVFKLHNFLALNIRDTSRDYFGITPVEDYIAKLTLTFNNQMVLPTMSDKKTWYSISGLELVRDNLTSKALDEGIVNYYSMLGLELPEDVSPFTNINRSFSSNTLNIFVNYWLDEFDAVFDYYAHKTYVEQNPTKRVDNYHGKIKNGKMDASGNGGRFRYFSSMRFNDNIINVNEDLADLEQNASNEEVMKYLLDLKVLMLGKENVNTLDSISSDSNIFSAMNNLLVGATSRELAKLVDRGIVVLRNGHYANKLVPYNIMQYYKKLVGKAMYDMLENSLFEEDVLYSIIGSHVANSAISIIEVEKCFTGDPAYYKWKKFKKEVKDDAGDVIKAYDVISGRDVDKIKRLSAALSTGTNLRTIWDNPSENNSKISVLHLKDNEIGSKHFDELHKIFKNSILRDLLSLRHPEYDDDKLINELDTPEKELSFYNTLSSEQQKFVDNYAKASAKPYGDGEINQSDAAVYVRPALYRKIMKALGNWSDAIEEAYNIMEGEDESWMLDPLLYSKTTSALIKPLKMVYFGDHRDGSLNLNIPVFDKMAMFPMFKVLAKADNKLLYDRMNNEELGVIDMLTFESAVKVGGRLKFLTYLDTANETFNIEDLNKPSYDKFKQEGNLPVFTQDLSNLRLQLNTDPHEHIDRSFGTLAVKICLGNLVDDRSYGENKGQSVKGRQIKEQVMSAINRLTVKGANLVLNRFFKDNNVDNNELSKFLISLAKTAGMSGEVIDGFKLDEDGNFNIPLAATSSRQWVESRIISYVNKTVIDVNTPGGSAILMSAFGFKATQHRKQSAIGYAFNDGKPLNFLNKDGSMDMMLSTNFFRHIVPKEYQGSYGQMRKWLLEKGIIGSNSKPLGVGYRIPTQGLSSTFSFKVVDVLPDRLGDTVIVPDGFTAMTGSDFDVDKLYLATLNFDENGNILLYATDENGNELSVDKQGTKELLNKIIQSYQLVVSDNKNMAETRASIDTLTKILLNDILPLVLPSVNKAALPMYELLPSFLLARKEEYTGGKAGIAPFALNSTNHCLTQLIHLNMSYIKGNPYNLGLIDEIRSKDGYRILDWLSAMINAHVDVAKDPYIMTLNVNLITYNMTNLLLRGGVGKTTFYFLALPILKRFANAMISNKGVYGVDDKTENQIVADLYLAYSNIAKTKIYALSNEDAEKVGFIARYNGIADEIGLEPIINKETSTPIDKNKLFNDKKLINSLKDNTSIDHILTQLEVLRAYKELSTDALRLSELVHRSQIDTKKFGNTLSLLMNFRNSYETFIYDNADSFSIRGIPFDENNPLLPLRTYFGQTFLSTKLHHGTSLPRKILRTQSFPATQVFQDIFTSVMGIFGETRTIQYSNGKEALAYKHVGDKKLVNKFSQYVDSIIRARLSRDLNSLKATDVELVEMLYGSNSMCKRLTGIKLYIIENKDRLTSLVNQDSTIKNELLNYLQEYPGDGKVLIVDRIILSDSSLNNDYDTENRLISAFAELLQVDDEIINEFANDLAKYSYLTSYDERGVNSFFNLVPNFWKTDIGYIGKIKEGLSSFKSSSNQLAYSLISESNDNSEAMYYPSINIAIARNMWWDDEIVTPYDIDINKGDKYLHRSSDTVNGKVQLKIDLFSSSRTKGKEFIKVVNGSGANSVTELYRLVGKANYVNEEGAPIKKGLKYIYLRIPKLGINDNGFRVMEYQKESLEASAFSQNSFSEKSLLTEEQINELALKSLKQVKGNFTKQFVSTNNLTIKIRLKQDAKKIAGQEDGNVVVDNVVNAETDVEINEDIITEQMMLEADEFVYDTINEQFDAIDAMQDVVSQLDEISELATIFAEQSEQTLEVNEQQLVTDEIVDMGGIVELGKKRKDECK